ncbi:MAG: tRNA pseudouridine(55) synthase TruB [Proteobacteria bacterium]|nr:tRNA pseudouridine(55) synthase TruB [Pseudomonadota bacterium]
MTGFLVIDKPPGITSHDVVAVVRAVTGIKKVGHTGTLDPFATGVLPLALGGATRLIQFLDESIKIYDATIALGTATDTGDPTGPVIDTKPLPTVDEEAVEAALRGFVGERMQTPPKYSAVKHKGRPLYQYARMGQEVKVAARKITIHDMELKEYDREKLRVLITCGRGTYARVLADEVAEAIGTAGHLADLARLRSGPFFYDDALTMPHLAELVSAEENKTWEEVLLGRGPREERVKWKHRDEVMDGLKPFFKRPLDVLSHLPLVDVNPVDVKRIRSGGVAPLPPAGLAGQGVFLVVCGDELIAVAQQSGRGTRIVKVVDKPR